MANTSANRYVHLLSGRLLARNTLWNLVGNGVPVLVAIICIPILIKGLGTDRFGVLALAWTLVGYAGLFDLGLARALTKLVSEKLGTGRQTEIPELFWTSQAIMFAVAMVVALLFALVAPSLVHRALKIPTALQMDALDSFYALAFSVPVVISTAGLRGFLEAQQQFGIINALRVPMGVFTFLGPLLALPFSHAIFPIVVVLIAGRAIGWLAHLLFCLRVMPLLSSGVAIGMGEMAALFRLGGWMTVSNVIGPMMLYMDRFVIAAMVSASAVAYYATPYEVVTKLFIVSGAISAVMFPAFSLSAVHDLDQSSILYRRTMRYMFAILLPLTAVLIIGARRGLSFWLGPDFAANSYRVGQLLLVGTFALGMAALSFALIQSLGRPDIPAKLNLLEVPFYAAGLYWLIQKYGVTGAAAAWMLRATFDALLLIFFAQRLQRTQPSRFSDAAVVSDFS